MRTGLAIAVLLVLAGDTLAADASPGPLTGRITDRSRICMMQDTLQGKPGLEEQHDGKTYYLCCEMCVQAFSADPDRYTHATDPVNGTRVDKATAPIYAVGGRAFFFSSEETLKTFAADPARYLRGG